MIKHYLWKKYKSSLEFVSWHDIYSIESEHGKVYALSDGEFAVLGRIDAYRCDYEDMPQLATKLPELYNEILDIYEEIPDLRRLNII